VFAICSYRFRVFGLLSSAAFYSHNTAFWHIPFDISREKAFNSFFLSGIAQEQINYSISTMDSSCPSHSKTETPARARPSLEMGVMVAAFLLIAFILMRPWLPV
jgi:hypothetical protein